MRTKLRNKQLELKKQLDATKIDTSADSQRHTLMK